MVPVNTVTKDGFKNLLRTLDRRFQIPSRTYFSQVAIPQLYTESREKVVTELKNVDYYATTTDMWSSRTTEPYLSLTVHFVNDNFELKSRCLQIHAYFPTDHRIFFALYFWSKNLKNVHVFHVNKYIWKHFLPLVFIIALE